MPSRCLSRNENEFFQENSDEKEIDQQVMELWFMTMDQPMPQILNINRLKKGLPGVTQEQGAVHAQACVVCLEDQGHIPGAEISVNGSFDKAFKIRWEAGVSAQMKRGWQDEKEATEYAACGIAFLLVLKLTPYTVIQRSRTSTGFDYWLGANPANFAARLEVSGIRNSSPNNTVDRRTKQKLNQTTQSDDSKLPAYVVVVEFSKPLAQVSEK